MVYCSGAVAVPGQHPVSVKNTFLFYDDDLDEDDEPLPRRASSAPPASRSDSGLSQTTCGPEGSRCSPRGSPRSEFEEEDPSLPSTRDSDQGSSAGVPLAPVGAVHVAASTYSEPTSPMPWPEAAGGSTAGQPWRAPLNASAKMWEPSARAPGDAQSQPPLPAAVRRQFAGIAAAGLATLRALDAVVLTDVKEHPGGWELLAQLKPELCFCAPQVLEQVQQSFLLASNNSSSVYILGYAASPFVPLPLDFGCSCSLALVQDENRACWDLLSRGFCARGHTCRWEHSSCLAELSVRIV
eukprot:TRINITY_DN17638_c0_g7_i1.p1 TRINITY_DN17638_c0_g7~~TRINITY_DN17638_c0_g7_i1.p1  ORF type:complete len:297 (-),score=42.15 TRINITY_DN17638_c0_g7_i1:54-944(-)